MKRLTMSAFFLLAMLLMSNSWAGQTLPMMQVAEANPCAMKSDNPCAMKHKNACDMKMHNPCGMKHKNACDMKMHNPCGMKHKNACDMKMHNPCGMKHKNACDMQMHNPCGMKHKNPCGGMAADRIDAKLIKRPAGITLFSGVSRAQLVKEGEKLFRDPSLSPNKTTCNDCHTTNDLFKPGFAKPYPHPVGMAKVRAGVSGELHADEFVQFCMLAPMASKPLAWDSRELAALAAYVIDVKQKDFRAAMKANPCTMKHKNACDMKHKNPCGMKGGMKMHNPCAMKHENPCEMKHKNPCEMKQKNPCGM